MDRFKGGFCEDDPRKGVIPGYVIGKVYRHIKKERELECQRMTDLTLKICFGLRAFAFLVHCLDSYLESVRTKSSNASSSDSK